MKATARSTLGIFKSNPPPQPVATEVIEDSGAGMSSIRPDRTGRVMMPFWVPKAARIQLRVLAAEQDTTQQDLMTEALNDYFRKIGKPPIA